MYAHVIHKHAWPHGTVPTGIPTVLTDRSAHATHSGSPGRALGSFLDAGGRIGFCALGRFLEVEDEDDEDADDDDDDEDTVTGAIKFETIDCRSEKSPLERCVAVIAGLRDLAACLATGLEEAVASVAADRTTGARGWARSTILTARGEAAGADDEGSLSSSGSNCRATDSAAGFAGSGDGGSGPACGTGRGVGAGTATGAKGMSRRGGSATTVNGGGRAAPAGVAKEDRADALLLEELLLDRLVLPEEDVNDGAATGAV